VPCLAGAKFAMLWAGQRAADCMDNYRLDWVIDLSLTLLCPVGLG